MVIFSEYMIEIIHEIKKYKLLHFTPCINNVSFAPSFKNVCLGTVTFSLKKIHLLKMRHNFLPGKLTEKKIWGRRRFFTSASE